MRGETKSFRSSPVNLILLLIALFSQPSLAIENYPADYTPAPPGTNLLLMYNHFANYTSFYQDGKKVTGSGGLHTNINLLRGVHFMEYKGITFDPQFVLPFGRLEGRGKDAVLGGEGGTGDLLLTAAFWLVNNKAEGRYFAVAPFVILPTGSYDKRSPLNLGENRYKFIFQAGYIETLAKRYLLDLAADITYFGENDDFGPESRVLKQSPLMQMQFKFVRIMDENWKLSVGLTHTFGGEEEVSGVKLGNEKNDWRWETGLVWQVKPRYQVAAVYQRDLAVEHGFRMDHGLNLRFLHAF